MRLTKINPQVLDFDIIVYALGFSKSMVPVNRHNCFYFIGAQHQMFVMGGQHVIIEIFLHTFASDSMVFGSSKCCRKNEFAGTQISISEYMLSDLGRT